MGLVTWVVQQLRNATPFGEGPRFLVRDNDDKFGVDFDRAAKGAGVRVLRTAGGRPAGATMEPKGRPLLTWRRLVPIGPAGLAAAAPSPPGATRWF